MHKILVVDDEERIIEIIDKFLTTSGFEVIKSIGGEQAVKILNSDTQIDMMLLDMKMPKVNGLEVLQKMRDLGKNFPILFLTGSIDAETYVYNLEGIGFAKEDILYKPIDLPVLIEKIKKKLGIT